MIMDHMYHMGSALRWQYKCIWTCQMLCCNQKCFFGLFSCLLKATPDGTSKWLCFLILTLIKNSNLIPPYNNSKPSIKLPTACADLIWGLRLCHTPRATLYQILYVSRGLSDKLAVIVNQTEVKSAEPEEPHWPFLCMLLDFAQLKQNMNLFP